MTIKPVTLLLSLMIFLGGCATTSSGDQRDPLENFNRAIFSFNESVDNALLKPVAGGYRAVVPIPISNGINNFFSNIDDIVSAANSLLQFELKQGGADIIRVLSNSTIGIFGLFDVATDMGFKKHDEDFGQTLGHWGVGNGPYLMLPILGSSTLRDTAGLAIDNYYFDLLNQVDHTPTRTSLQATEAVSKRADLLGASSILEKAALDRYEFLKESYLQKREFDVNNGEFAFPDNAF